MTETVYFTKEDATRMWSHGFDVFIAKDTGVYLICWNPDTPKAPRVDMACGYLEDGFYLDENVPNTDPNWGDIWDASRAAVGGDDFCDDLSNPMHLMRDGDTHLAVEVTEDEIRTWWAKKVIPRKVAIVTVETSEEDAFVVGQSYTREEINKILGVSPDCECRIVTEGHVCP